MCAAECSTHRNRKNRGEIKAADPEGLKRGANGRRNWRQAGAGLTAAAPAAGMIPGRGLPAVPGTGTSGGLAGSADAYEGPEAGMEEDHPILLLFVRGEQRGRLTQEGLPSRPCYDVY